MTLKVIWPAESVSSRRRSTPGNPHLVDNVVTTPALVWCGLSARFAGSSRRDAGCLKIAGQIRFVDAVQREHARRDDDGPSDRWGTHPHQNDVAIAT